MSMKWFFAYHIAFTHASTFFSLFTTEAEANIDKKKLVVTFPVIVFAVLVSHLFVNISVREKKEKQGCQEKMEMLALRYY